VLAVLVSATLVYFAVRQLTIGWTITGLSLFQPSAGQISPTICSKLTSM